MYNDFSDEQCRILKLIMSDLPKGNHTSVLYSSDLVGICNVERLLQGLKNGGLLDDFKKLSNTNELTKEERDHLSNAYGAGVIRQATEVGEGYLVFASIIFEEDYDYIAEKIKSHDRVKLHKGVHYELVYNQDNKYVLRYFDYVQGYEKKVIHVYSGGSVEKMLDYLFNHPNRVSTAEEMKLGAKSKNVAQIINSLRMPKKLESLFFQEPTRKSVRFRPKVGKEETITYEQGEEWDYMSDANEI